jgi:outer membrane protein
MLRLATRLPPTSVTDKVPASMPRMLLLVLAALAASAVASPPATAAAAEVEALERLALVDVQRCIMETKEGRRAKKDLEDTFAKGQARIDRKAKDLQKRFTDLQAKAPLLSQDVLQKRQEELMRSQAELEQLGAELQQEVVEKEGLLTEQIYARVADIVEQIALEEKIQVVLVRSEMTVLWADPKLDLTNRVIVRYDKNHK